MQTTGEVLDISLYHYTSSSSTTQALNIASTMGKILNEILTRPDAAVSDLNCVSDRNLKFITEWNNDPLDTVDRCIHEIIHDQALSKPHAEAVCDEHGSISYRDLDQISSRLASHLVALGLGPGDFVPLCFEKEVWNVVSTIAVLKAGAAFVPLDPAAPVVRLRALAVDVGASIVLCSQQHAGMLLPVADHIIPVDGEVIGHLPKSNLNDRPVKSTDLAYV